MAGGKSMARSKKAASAKGPTKSARSTAAKTAKPASSARAKRTARAKPAPAKRTARAPAAKAPAAKAPARRAPAARSGTGNALDKLQQVALTATNLDASVDFYRDVLGLRFITRFDPPGLAFFSLGGGIRLLLSATASQASLYFLVDDVAAMAKELRGRGVQFLQQQPQMIHRDEAGDFGKKGAEEWMAFFRDPAGNLLALVERR